MDQLNFKLVSIVIVTRNRKGLVLDCLNSVFKLDYPVFEVILVDNASEDATKEAVNEKFPLVNVLRSKINLGLNGGKNLGQKYAKGEYIFFLDSDTKVDRELLKELVKVALSDEAIGIVCPKMYYCEPDNVIWYAGSYVNLLTSQTKNIGCNEEDHGQWDKVRETEFAPTAYLAKMNVVKKLKGHNEYLFMTYGDTDYGFRAREAGFKVVFCPKAKLWHHLKHNDNTKTIRALGYNLPMRAYYFSRNRVVFMKDHAPAANFLVFLFFIFPLITILISYKILAFKGSFNLLKLHLLGSRDGYLYAFGFKPENLLKA